CEQKRNSIKEDAKTKLKQAIDSRVTYLQSEIKERVNEVRQRCSLRLGWIVDRVQQAVNDAAYFAQYNASDYVQIGYNKGLNGRILYPHSLDEASGEYGNPVPGTKVILYTQDLKPYQVSVSGDIQTALPGLSATMNTQETHDDELMWSRDSYPSVTFKPENCSIHINANVFRKTWDHRGSRHGFHHKHYTYRQWADVSVTIPDGWSFGYVPWNGLQNIKNQTITFSAQDGFSAQIPPIPIRM
ncbi:MAG: hypothetical protein EZS28_038209, partial [Streblomastix strix]